MPTFEFTSPQGKTYTVEGPEGATREQAFQILQEQIGQASGLRQEAKPPKARRATFKEEIRNIPRQLGLTARYGIEGLADVAGILSNPIAATSNALLGTKLRPLRTATTQALAGLPSPDSASERIVGDASRLLAGGGAMLGATGAVRGGGAVTRKVLDTMAARPGLQAAAAVGAGGAGGYTREAGGGPGAQFLASLAGGIAAPGAVAGALRPKRNMDIDNALAASGIKLADIPKPAAALIQSDVAQAKGAISPDALRRLIDYRLVGAVPGRANLTLNPIDITRQKDLTKIGAHSPDPSIQTLAKREHDNIEGLLRGLNVLGADTGDDALTGGARVMGGLARTMTQKQKEISAAYDAALAKGGGLDARLDTEFFTNRVNKLLKDNLLDRFLPSGVYRAMKELDTGETPFTVRNAEQIKTAIGDLQRSSTNGNVRSALSMVRQAMDESPLVTRADLGEDTIKAFNKARGLNRNWRKLIEKTPALKAIEDGVEPDKFVQNYIIQQGGKANVADVGRLKAAIKESPDAATAVREQILLHLKDKATGGSPDEAVKFSQSGYNKALKAIGDQKLSMFFSKADIEQLNVIGRVARYEQAQPAGSAVNNSNTASALFTRMFESLASNRITAALPFGAPFVNNPARALITGRHSRNMLNIPNALLVPKARNQPQWFPSPLLLTPGLLSEEDRR